MTDALEFELTREGHRYRGLLAGHDVAYSEVDPISTDGLLIKHTEVSPEPPMPGERSKSGLHGQPHACGCIPLNDCIVPAREARFHRKWED
jgi:hypothetical protein